ncbi:MAG: GNAT family N-acetyltransferase, partial [Polyangiales bacterium]
MALSVRPATPEDHALFVPFFLSFEMPDPIPDLAWWTKFCQHACFLEENGKALGYGLAYKLEESGYVMHCAVDASARNRGVGRAVMLTLAKRLRDLGCAQWTLNVKVGNEPAIALYQHLGMHVDFPVAALRIPWAAVDAMPKATRVAESFEGSEDRGIEDQFDLEHGRVSRPRELGRVIMRVRKGDRTTGVIGFDPSFPGAPLFRAQTFEDARALFDGIRPTAKPEHDYFRIIVEANEPLADRLVEAGATRVMSLLHMVGPIPRE